jgi:hypothetical protein
MKVKKMNERIKQLSIKAGFPEWSNHAIEFELEQFADSIVWECMKICEDVMKKDNSALACWSAIKGTFRS